MSWLVNAAFHLEHHEGREIAMIHQDSNQINLPSEASRELLDILLKRMAKIESSLDLLVTQQTIKEWYITEEVAEILGKAPFTVREWCRHGRVTATKRNCGRGNSKEWIISRKELLRIQNEGLLPEALPPYRHIG